MQDFDLKESRLAHMCWHEGTLKWGHLYGISNEDMMEYMDILLETNRRQDNKPKGAKNVWSWRNMSKADSRRQRGRAPA